MMCGDGTLLQIDRIQSVGTGYDPLPCAVWDGKRKGKGEADRAAADYRG